MVYMCNASEYGGPMLHGVSSYLNNMADTDTAHGVTAVALRGSILQQSDQSLSDQQR